MNTHSQRPISAATTDSIQIHHSTRQVAQSVLQIRQFPADTPILASFRDSKGIETRTRSVDRTRKEVHPEGSETLREKETYLMIKGRRK
jgi:hypothetical protein